MRCPAVTHSASASCPKRRCAGRQREIKAVRSPTPGARDLRSGWRDYKRCRPMPPPLFIARGERISRDCAVCSPMRSDSMVPSISRFRCAHRALRASYPYSRSRITTIVASLLSGKSAHADLRSTCAGVRADIVASGNRLRPTLRQQTRFPANTCNWRPAIYRREWQALGEPVERERARERHDLPAVTTGPKRPCSSRLLSPACVFCRAVSPSVLGFLDCHARHGRSLAGLLR